MTLSNTFEYVGSNIFPSPGNHVSSTGTVWAAWTLVGFLPRVCPLVISHASSIICGVLASVKGAIDDPLRYDGRGVGSMSRRDAIGGAQGGHIRMDINEDDILMLYACVRVGKIMHIGIKRGKTSLKRDIYQKHKKTHLENLLRRRLADVSGRMSTAAVL